MTADQTYYDYSIGPILLALAVGLLARSHLVKFLPYTVWLLIGGMAVGVTYSSDVTILNEGLEKSVDDWVELDPKALFTVFMPVLIFVSAWGIHGHLMRRQIGQILWLAFPAVVLGTFLTGAFIKYSTSYGWDWDICLLIGTIVSSTDPVATVALLKEQGVNNKISTLIEGESLFNDGSALVIFHLLLNAAKGEQIDPSYIPIFFIRSSAGGAILGFILGLAASQVLRVIVNDSLAEITLTLVMCHSTWLLAEYTPIHVSGVMAVVTMGLSLSAHGRSFVSPSVQGSLDDFWYLMDFIANTVIFFVAGIIIIGQLVAQKRDIVGSDWAQLLYLFLILYAVRLVIVLISWPLLSRTGYKLNWRQGALLVHSGLRGSVALVLALIVDGTQEIDRSTRDKIVFLVSGIAVMTLVLQGSTTRLLVHGLRLNQRSEAETEQYNRACTRLEKSLQRDVESFKKDSFMAEADWTAVWRYLPVFTAESYWTRIVEGHIQVADDEIDDIVAVASIAKNNNNLGIDTNANLFDNDDQIKVEANDGDVEQGVKKMPRIGFFDKISNRIHRIITGNNTKYVHVPSRLVDTWRGHAQRYGGQAFSLPTLDLENLNFRAFLESRMTNNSKFTSTKNESSVDMIDGLYMTEDHDFKDGSLHSKWHQKLDSRPVPHTSMQEALNRGATIADSTAKTYVFSVLELSEKERVIQWRVRFLEALRAQYTVLFQQGRLTGSGLKVLKNSINAAEDLVEKGEEIDSWSYINKKYCKSSLFVRFAGFICGDNWRKFLRGPLRQLHAHFFHKKLNFVMQIVWNFVSAHRGALETRQLALRDPHQAKIIHNEHNQQMDLAEQELSQLIIQNSVQARSIKTQMAARTMLFSAQDHINSLHKAGRINSKEAEYLTQGVTLSLQALPYHPAIERKPPLIQTLARVEFLHSLSTNELEYIAGLGLVREKEYVGCIELLRDGEVGGRAGCGCYYVVRGSVVRLFKEKPPENQVKLRREISDSAQPIKNGMENVDEKITTETGSPKNIRLRELPKGAPIYAIGQNLSTRTLKQKDSFNSNFHRGSKINLLKGMFHTPGSANGSMKNLLKTETNGNSASISRRFGYGNMGPGMLKSMGLLFGVTDALLGIPQHATYHTGAYASLLFFDIPGLLIVSHMMPSLSLGLWSTLGAHLLSACNAAYPVGCVYPYSALSLRRIHHILAAASFYDGASTDNKSLSLNLNSKDTSSIIQQETQNLKIELPAGAQAIVLKGQIVFQSDSSNGDLTNVECIYLNKRDNEMYMNTTPHQQSPLVPVIGYTWGDLNPSHNRLDAEAGIKISNIMHALVPPLLLQNSGSHSIQFCVAGQGKVFVLNPTILKNGE